MKQIASAYTYNKTTGVITLTGVNIDRDQLLLIVNTTRNVTYYNFADSATTLQAFTQGENTSLALNSSVVTASSAHANGDALIIYYDDQASTVTANGGNFLNTDNALIAKDSASNLVLLGGLSYNATPTQSAIDALVTDGNGKLAVYQSETRWTDTNAGGQSRAASQQTPFPVQVLGGSVTIDSLPAISGTVTANQYTTITSGSVAVGSNSGLIDISSYPNGTVFSVEAQPTGGANGVYKIQHMDNFGLGATDISVTNIFTGTSAINISAAGTYSFRKNQFVTHLRFTYVSGTGGNAKYTIRAFSESYWNQTIPVSISNRPDQGVSGQGTVDSFTSLTSAVLRNQNSTRKLLTIFNEGSGTLFILLGGGTASTTNYSLRLLAGDFYELDKYTGEVNAIFATAGTAKVTEIT